MNGQGELKDPKCQHCYINLKCEVETETKETIKQFQQSLEVSDDVAANLYEGPLKDKETVKLIHLHIDICTFYFCTVLFFSAIC